MNIWRRCLPSSNNTPAPTPITPWDNSKIVYTENIALSRKVVNNENVATSNTERWCCDSLLPASRFERVYIAYKADGTALAEHTSVAGIARLYPFKPNFGGDFQYLEDYDNHSIQYTSGNTVAFYSIYYVSNMAELSYWAVVDALKKNSFYKNIPGPTPTPTPTSNSPVIYYKNGIYRATKENITPSYNENTLVNGFKIGSNTTLYNIQGPFAINSRNRVIYPFPYTGAVISGTGRPWSHTTLQNRYLNETGGTIETIPAYVTYNGINYYPSYYVNNIPFAPISFHSYALSGTNMHVCIVTIASSNFNIQEQTIPTY